MPTKITKVKISKKSGKNKQKSLKIQKGGEIDENLKSLLDFFNVVDANREYLVNAWSDAIELYNIVDWNSASQDKLEFVEFRNIQDKILNSRLKSSEFIFNGDIKINIMKGGGYIPSANSNLVISLNNISITGKPKHYKTNNTIHNTIYLKDSIIKTRNITKPITSYISIAKIRFNSTSDLIPEFTLTLLKKQNKTQDKSEFDEYLILANYGKYFNPYSDDFTMILQKLYEYLHQHIRKSTEKTNEKIKILFFGHSMGALIVQHLYLYFVRKLMFVKIFLISSCQGNTLSMEDNEYFNSSLRGYFISYGFCMIRPYLKFEQKFLEYKISDTEEKVRIEELLDKLIIDNRLIRTHNKLETIQTILIQIQLYEKTSEPEAESIIAFANLNKFNYLETHNAYGYNEPVFFDIIHLFKTTRNALLKLLHL